MPAIMKEVNLHQHHYHDHRWWRLKFQRERESERWPKKFSMWPTHFHLKRFYCKAPEQKYIFKISTLNLHIINQCFSLINLF